jgi:site-specific DNA-methyltransferase (cytosine-N4-specific)
MPESVTDRPTSAHEKIYLLTKSAKYYYNADAVREPFRDRGMKSVSPIGKIKMPDGWATYPGDHGSYHKNGREKGKTKYSEDNSMGGGGTGFVGHSGCVKSDGSPITSHDGRNLRNVWNISLQPYPDAHFATFPEEIPRRCILAGSREGDIILDPFAGSGTTLKVAAELNRRSIGIELNPEYVELIKKRVTKAATQEFLF